MLEFLLGVGGIFERGGNLEGDQFAQALAQAVDPHRDGGAGGAEVACGALIIAARGRGVEKGPEPVEDRRALGGGLFFAELVGGAGEERDGPGAFVGLTGIELGGGEPGKLRFRVGEGQMRNAAAAFPGGRAFVFAGKVLAERPDQIAAKFAPGRIGPLQKITGDQIGEESLGQILGIGGRRPLATKETVDGRPVSAAEMLERGALLGGVALTAEHHAPEGGLETC